VPNAETPSFGNASKVRDDNTGVEDGDEEEFGPYILTRQLPTRKNEGEPIGYQDQQEEEKSLE